MSGPTALLQRRAAAPAAWPLTVVTAAFCRPQRAAPTFVPSLLSPSSSSSSSSLFGLRSAATSARPPQDDDDMAAAFYGRPQYKAKKVWPPDFSRLSPQEQLRFEKRYKRRVALRSARPRWIKFIKLAQLFSITFVVIYGVLFMEWEHGPQPFAEVRTWFWDTLGLLRGRQQSSVQRSGEGRDQAAAAAAAAAAQPHHER